MKIGVPTEVKNREYRVAITPAGVHELVQRGHEVHVQQGAGLGSSITDEQYQAQGARIVESVDDVWADAEMILKVKEPIEQEYGYLRSDLVLFTYLHLAADEPLTRRLADSGTTAIAYETVEQANGTLPLLYPMSEVAGCLAPQVGAHSLMKAQGGRGVLMGNIGGVSPAKVAVIGGGVTGQNAAAIALGMGAEVTILDTSVDKLRQIGWRWKGAVKTLFSSKLALAEVVAESDMVIGSVLIPGAKAPKLVTNDMVATMKRGSVLVDIAIDQGGCFEDSHATTHDDPTFEVHGSVFYCVANMPGAVPHTSTYALTNATLPYAVTLADLGWREALKADAVLEPGLNTHGGRVTYQAVAEAFGMDYTPTSEVLA